MKVITEVKWIDVPNDIWEIAHMKLPESRIRLDTESGTEFMRAEYVREVIRGTRIKNPFNGIDIILGASVQGSEIIGCAYDSFESMQLNLDSKNRELSARKRDLAKIRSAGFLTRLKWLFAGVA